MWVDSTHSGRVVNHVYPDADRTVGLELKHVIEEAYPDNLIKAVYKESEDKKYNATRAVSQEKQRKKWLQEIEKIKNQALS